MNDTVVNHIMYADNLVLISPSVAGLKKLLVHCEQFGMNHDVMYNSQKSAIMIFRAKALKDSPLPNFILNGEIVNEADNFKYPGHFISNDLSDDLDIKRQCHKLFSQVNFLQRKYHIQIRHQLKADLIN